MPRATTSSWKIGGTGWALCISQRVTPLNGSRGIGPASSQRQPLPAPLDRDQRHRSTRSPCRLPPQPPSALLSASSCSTPAVQYARHDARIPARSRTPLWRPLCCTLLGFWQLPCPGQAGKLSTTTADETWPKIVEDAARGKLQETYAPVDETGKERKPSLQPYPSIPWESMNLDQFNLIPKVAAPLLRRVGGGWGTFRIIPIESGRGCPYGCEFCTVTGFFGDSIRFRTNESVVDELLRVKKRARSENGQMAVFFIDDNFAINIKRTKSLLRDIIAANAQVHWVAQISANLLRDEELIDLIAASGGKWIFIGMESIDPANLASVNKGFNKPGEYRAVLQSLADRNIYAITSFIFGMDNDTSGVAERTLQQIRTWPPGLPVFGLLTPLPATPIYDRLGKEGRLTRPKHWQEFIPFAMAHTPLKMSIEEAHREVRIGWANSYSPQAIERAVDSLNDKLLGYRINILIG